MRRIVQMTPKAEMGRIWLVIEFMRSFLSHLDLSIRKHHRRVIDLQSSFPFCP